MYDTDSGKVHKRETVSISSIETNGLAYDNLEVGDIINSITIDGVKYDVTRMFVVTDAMLNARVDSIVTVNVTRAGASRDVRIIIAESSLTGIK